MEVLYCLWHSCSVKLAEFLPYVKWQKHSLQYIPLLPPPYWMTSSTALTPLNLFQSLNSQVLELYQSCWNVVVQCYFRTFPKRHLFSFLGRERGRGDYSMVKSRKEYLYYCILLLSSRFMIFFMTRQWMMDIFKKWHFPSDNPSLGQDILISQLPGRNSFWMK